MTKVIKMPERKHIDSWKQNKLAKSPVLKKIRKINLLENLLAASFTAYSDEPSLTISNNIAKIITNFNIKLFFYYFNGKVKVAGNRHSLIQWYKGGVKDKIETDLAKYLISSGQYFIVDVIEECGIEYARYIDFTPCKDTTNKMLDLNKPTSGNHVYFHNLDNDNYPFDTDFEDDDDNE